MPKNEITIINSKDVRVRILTLSVAENTAWHFHTKIVDNIFCLNGEIIVHLKEPDERIRLHPGQRCEVALGRVHQVANENDIEAQYLLIQGVGEYDFNKIEG
jgi:mannose-6-phosphate isomerase-like protein (cupin superfamily)